jgi:23S rRNA (guanosine2251-2'-O)-methyltransferase
MKADLSIIFGTNAVLEKLKASPRDIVEILLADEAGGAVEAEARRLGVRVTRVNRVVLDQITHGARNQGVAARVAAFCYRPFTEFLDGTASAGQRCRILVLDGITDPRNFGALLRCAEGAGVPDIVIPRDRSVGVTPTVIKSSAGAAHHVNIYRVINLRQAMKQLKDRGFWLVGLEAGATTSIYDRSYPERLGIVLGSEGRGLRPLVRQECDFLASIPMSGKIDALNVAVAGAVFLYELRRQVSNVDTGKGRG